MFNTDFTKMFDPSQYTQSYTQNMQKFFDWTNTMSAGQQNMNTMKEVGTLLTSTISSCTEKQFKYAQSTMEDCIETMRELSTVKGMEEYMSKQSEISKRAAEKAQSVAQEIASQWQKTQAQCTDIIGQQMAQTMEWSKSMSNSVASSVASATKNATSSK
jgi:phasin family protein